jgi:post-segregation antitoxin (ccd killing protein)
MSNVLQIGGSTLIVTPGHRTGFALSHSNRSPILLFELQPSVQSAEGMLAMLLNVLGSKSEFIRYVLVVDTPALPGAKAHRVNDSKTAAVALAQACGAELRSLDWQVAKAIASDAGVMVSASTGLASAIETYRRILAAKGERLGELLHPVNPDRQADHSELRALARHVSTN